MKWSFGIRLLSIILVVFFVCGSIHVDAAQVGDSQSTKQLAQTFPDIKNHWCKSIIEKFLRKNWVKGYEDGFFKPDKLITRAEFTAMVIRILDKVDENAEYSFSDVSKKDWFYREVSASVKEKYIEGYSNGTFKPYKEMSRQEVAVFVQRLLKVDPFQGEVLINFKDESIFSDWSAYSIKALASHEIVRGYTDGTFRPTKLTSRAEAVKMLDVILKKLNIIIETEKPIPGAVVSTPTSTNTPTSIPVSYVTPVPTNTVVYNSILAPILSIPSADFKVDSIYYRDPAKDNMAYVILKDMSISSTGKEIRQRIWKVKHDDNNDGSFEDEEWETISNANLTNPVYKTSKLGKYLVELEVSENSDYSKAKDYEKADTKTKLYTEKIFVVDNTAPIADFSIEKTKKLDMVFTVGKADEDKLDAFSQKIKETQQKAIYEGIDTRISSISTQTYTTSNTFDWQEYDHYNYVDSYANPAWPNPMPKHILFNGKDIQMVGYTVKALKDILFVPDKNKTQKTFTFDIKRDTTNWHSIEGGGFLFNASIENNILKGYCILITASGLKLDEIQGINLTQFLDGKYELVEEAGKKLATYSIGDVYANHSWKIVIDTQSISLWDNGSLIIDNFKLPNTEYGSGFGPIVSHANHSCSQMSYFTFKNIQMSTVVGKSLTEALDEYKWRSQAEKVLVNLSEEPLYELISDEKIAQVSSKLLRNSIDLYALGNDINKSQYESVIRGTGSGFFSSNSDIGKAMDGLSEYVLNKFKGRDYSISTYLEKGEEILYNKSYSDKENDPQYAEHWTYSHNPNVYSNNKEMSVFDSVYSSVYGSSQPITFLDKIGDYTITLKCQDNPVGSNDQLREYRKWSDENQSRKYISIHRAPEASIIVNAGLNDDKTLAKVIVSETAYDLDHLGEPEDGIVKKEYKWKNIKDENWTYSEFPHTLELNNDYLFVLVATDKEGSCSKPSTALVSTRSLGEINLPKEDKIKPTVSLSFSRSQAIQNQDVVITANMSDNIGVAYTKATINDKPAYFDTKGICIYNADTVGEIKVHIEVYDAAGNFASADKIFKVVSDVAPVVSISPATSTISVNQALRLTVNASDDVGVTKVETNMDGVPVALDASRSFTITPDKVGNISITASVYDTAGNISIAEKIIAVTLDTSSPNVSISSSLNTVAVGQPFNITISATDNVKATKITADIDGTPLTLNSSNGCTITPTTIGTLKINAFAYDAMDNVGTIQKEIIVTEDMTKPSASISFSQSSVIAGNTSSATRNVTVVANTTTP